MSICSRLSNMHSFNQTVLSVRSFSALHNRFTPISPSSPSTQEKIALFRHLLKLVNRTQNGQHQLFHQHRQIILKSAIDESAESIIQKVKVPHKPTKFTENLKKMLRNQTNDELYFVGHNYAQLLHSNLLHSFHLYESGWSSANESLKSKSVIDNVANRVGLQLTEKQLKYREEIQKDTKTEFYKSKLK